MLTRWVRTCCAAGASLLFGILRAQDFGYTNTNGTITITGYKGAGGSVVIPGTINGLPVTSIGDGALSFINLNDQSNLTGLSNMTSVIIPDTVTNLGEGAFAGCPNLATISIGKGITRIKGGAETSSWGTFQWCSSLTRVTIPDNVTNIGDGVGTRGGPFGAFSGCESLTNFIVGKGLAYLGDGTFTYCNNLLSVYFQGNAPPFGASEYPAPTSPFFNATNAIVYYLPGTSGWGPSYAGRPAVLWNPQDLSSAQQWKESQLPARGLGLQLHSMEVSSADKCEGAFKEATKARSGALAVTLNPVANSNQKQIADLAIERVEAERILAATRSAFAGDAALLDDAVRAAGEAAMRELETAVAGTDHLAVRAAIGALDVATKPFAQLRMNRAVAAQLHGVSLDEAARKVGA
jgi:hypothetical protein